MAVGYKFIIAAHCLKIDFILHLIPVGSGLGVGAIFGIITATLLGTLAIATACCVCCQKGLFTTMCGRWRWWRRPVKVVPPTIVEVPVPSTQVVPLANSYGNAFGVFGDLSRYYESRYGFQVG